MIINLNHFILHEGIHVGLTSKMIATSHTQPALLPRIALSLSAQKALLLGGHQRLIVERRGHFHNARSAHAVTSTSR